MRVLLAEDQPKMAEHIRLGLSAEGYAVDVATDGEEALWLASENPYDALILDVMMPARDGFSVVRQLRHKQINTPVIFLTARADVEDRVRGLDAGADDYLTKPFSMRELMARVKAQLRRARLLREEQSAETHEVRSTQHAILCGEFCAAAKRRDSRYAQTGLSFDFRADRLANC